MRRRVYNGSKPDMNTLLLLHAEDFTDSSIYNRSITNYNTTIGNAGKFDKCFDFSSGKRISLPDEVLVDRINDDWTIDFWVRLDSSKYGCPILSAWGYRTNILLSSNYSTLFLFKGNSVEIGHFTTTPNAWQHIAITNKKNVTKIYLMGQLQGQGQTSVAGKSSLYLNYKEDTNSYSNFLIDEFRVSDIVRWVSNFTPPTKPY